MAIPQKSIKTLEGQLVLAVNVAAALGVVIIASLDVAARQPLFSHYANQLTTLGTGVGVLDGWFALLRTYLKAQLGDTTTTNVNTTTTTEPAINQNLSSGVVRNG